ncbi:peptidase C39 family protein [Schaalia sp. 19OD2882]|uniref:peptidase C39 family protein n=1 Tax=Schaalia sp. 19OD2882 TaxID=2794089 RepID=UPI001C1F0A32|nr:peptidase C39 family protein [Schaalia sp. 19OD2882]QWW19052.1 peptidase C39 family protein [Schaalia sp. 19OD2882]
MSICPRAFTPGEHLAELLRVEGVPENLLEHWCAIGPRHVPTLWEHTLADGGRVLVWETHRVLASQRVIVGWCVASAASCAGEEGGDGAHPTWDQSVVEPALAALVESVAAAARRDRALLVKAQSLPEDHLLARVLEGRGFIPLEEPPAPTSSALHATSPLHGIRGWVRCSDGAGPDLQAMPFHQRQKTEYTCGPACALMVLPDGLERVDATSGGAGQEIAMWREATYTGGCGHYGLGAAMARRGVSVTICCDVEGPVIGLPGPGALHSEAVRRLIHDDHRRQALEAGAAERIEPLALETLDRALEDGRRVLVLVDLVLLNGEDVPHWVLVWAKTGGHYLVHDPWNDEHMGESWVHTCAMPISGRDLWRIASWAEGGRPPHRAAVIV